MCRTCTRLVLESRASCSGVAQRQVSLGANRTDASDTRDFTQGDSGVTDRLVGWSGSTGSPDIPRLRICCLGELLRNLGKFPGALKILLIDPGLDLLVQHIPQMPD